MRWRIAGLQPIPVSGIEPIPETKKRQTDESILETSSAGCDIRGRRNCWRECPWRNRHKQRKCRRILPPGRNRSHDRLRLRHDGAMQGGLCRHRRRLLPRSQAQHYRQCIQQPQQQPQCPRYQPHAAHARRGVCMATTAIRIHKRRSPGADRHRLSNREPARAIRAGNFSRLEIAREFANFCVFAIAEALTIASKALRGLKD